MSSVLGRHTSSEQLHPIDPDQVPDQIGTVAAWRAWTTTTEGELRLLSPNSTIWHPGQRSEAICARTSHSRAAQQPMCEDDCNCGFNGFAKPGHLWRQYTEYEVWGQVRLWGRVRSYAKGHRGQYAYVSRLFVDPRKFGKRSQAHELATQLADIYQVPTGVRCRPRHQPLYATQLLWRSWPARPVRATVSWITKPVPPPSGPDHHVSTHLSILLAALPALVLLTAFALVVLTLASTLAFVEHYEHPKLVVSASVVGLLIAGIGLACLLLEKLWFSAVRSVWENAGTGVALMGGMVGTVGCVCGLMVTLVASPGSWDPHVKSVEWDRYSALASKRDESVRYKLSDSTRDSFESTYNLDGKQTSCDVADADGAVLVCRTGDKVSWHSIEQIASLP